jgi:hypothetical protein
LIDINVWLPVTRDLHPGHSSASRWYCTLSQANDAALLFCRMTMLGLLRLLTNRAVMGDSTAAVSDALKVYDQWMRDPRVELSPEPRGIDRVFRQALEPVADRPATKVIAACYLVGLAGLAKGRAVPVTLIRAL